MATQDQDSAQILWDELERGSTQIQQPAPSEEALSLWQELESGPSGGDPDTSYGGLAGYSVGGAAKDFAGGAMNFTGEAMRFAEEVRGKIRGMLGAGQLPEGPVARAGKYLEENAPSSGQEGFAPDLMGTLGGSAAAAPPAALVALLGGGPLAIAGAMGATGAYMGAGQEYFTHLAATGDEDASWEAAAWGAGFGSTEAFGAVGQILGRINKASGGALRRSLLQSVVKPLLKESLGEGATELVQGSGTEIIAKHLREDELPLLQAAIAAANDPDARKRVGYGTLLGATSGGGMSVIGSAVELAADRIGAEKLQAEDSAAVTPQQAPQEAREPLDGDVLSEPEIHAKGQEEASPGSEEVSKPIIEADNRVTVPEGFTGEPLIAPDSPDAALESAPAPEAVEPDIVDPGQDPAVSGQAVPDSEQNVASEPVAVSEGALGEQQQELPLADEQQGAVESQESTGIPIESPDAAPVDAEAASTQPVDETADDKDERTTSIKHRVVDAELIEMDMDPVTKSQRETIDQWDAEAEGIIDADADAGRKLSEELSTSDRAVTPVEGSVLLRERNRLHVERESIEDEILAAQQEGNKDLINIKEQQADLNQQEFERASQVLDRVGTVAGQALRQRQEIMRRDWSIQTMQRRAKIANGGQEISAEAKTKLRDQANEIKRLMKKAEGSKARTEQLEAELAAEKSLNKLKPKPSPKRKAGTKKTPRKDRAKPVVEFVTRRANEARARIKARGTRMMAGIDPIEVADYAIIGAEQLVKGLDVFADWSTAMVGEFGDAIKPHLKDLFSKSKATLATMRGEFTRDSVLTGLRDSDKSNSDLRIAAKKLVRIIVGEGTFDRAEVMSKLHEALQEFDPNMTERQAMDLFSDYGITQQLSKDEVSVRTRQLRAEAQVLSKIEDVLKELAPKKTGQERQAPTAETRRLTKELHRLMKQAGITTTDPATQLASALDSIKTRLSNMIEDIERQLESGVRDEVSTVPPPSDAETVALRERLSDLRKQYDALFNPAKQEPGKAEVSRLRAAEKSAAKAIADYEQRISDGETEARSRGKGILSPKLKAQRARLAALREELQLLREAKNPKKSAEEISLQAKKTRMANETARLKEQQARGDYGPKAKKTPLKLDDEGVKLEAELMKVRREVQRDMNRYKHENMDSEEKFRYWSREILESIPRSARSAWDHSSVLRQGLVLSFDVRRSVPAFARSLTTAFSDENFLRIQAAIEQRDNYALAEEAKLINTGDMETIGAHEEAIHANIVEKIPLFGAGVKASNRLFITYMNLLRSSIFDYEVNSASTHGAMTKTEMAELANMLNISTGHGNPGGFAKSFGVLSHALWSPKLLLSRVQLMLGPLTAMAPGGKVLGIQVPGIRTSTPRMKRIVAKMYARYFIGTATMYALSGMMGNDVEDDVRSSDFGKIRTPNGTRIDVMGGASQVAVFVGRNYYGEAKSTRTGNIIDLRGEGKSYAGSDIENIWSRFGRSKLTPFLGVTANIITGENIIGEKTTPLTVARDLVVPLSFLDLVEAMEAEGIAKGTAISIVSLMGFGIYNIQDQQASSGKRRTRKKRSRR